MKNKLVRTISQVAFTFVLASGMLVSCDTAPKGDTAVVGEAGQAAEITGMIFNVDTTSSLVNFSGNGVGKNHPGHFDVSGGTIAIKGQEITGGNFIIDINSMAMTETESYINGKLRPHLLSPDFFDVATYPTASFEITSVEAYTSTASDSSVVAGANKKISGNLKLKNSVKNISFPAKVDMIDGSLTAIANFDIDRTAWDMSYGNDKSLGDKFISPTVNMTLNLSAKQQ